MFLCILRLTPALCNIVLRLRLLKIYPTSTQYGDTVAHALDPAGVFVDKKPVVKLCMENQEYLTKPASGNSDVWVWGEEFAFVVTNSATLLELEISESGFVIIPVAQLISGNEYYFNFSCLV